MKDVDQKVGAQPIEDSTAPQGVELDMNDPNSTDAKAAELLRKAARGGPMAASMAKLATIMTRQTTWIREEQLRANPEDQELQNQARSARTNLDAMQDIAKIVSNDPDYLKRLEIEKP